MNNDVEKILEGLIELSGKHTDNVYIVGGAVRDILMSKSPGDIDFALSDAPVVAKTLADRNNLPLVRLDQTPERETFRVVLDQDRFFDFTTLQGESIEEDLAQRDFTINAMAIHLGEYLTENPVIIDPFDGQKDLKNKIIRILPRPVFQNDPLRLLRVFRFSATLEFSIESKTLAQIKQHKTRIKDSAMERISHELLIWLGAPHSNLHIMESTGLLEELFPQIAELKSQPGSSSQSSFWDDIKNAFKELEDIFLFPGRYLEDYGNLVHTCISNKTRRALMKWCILERTPAGSFTENYSLEKKLARFRLSNTDIRFMTRALHFCNLVLETTRRPGGGFGKDSDIYELIRQSDAELISALMLALSIRLGSHEDIKLFIPFLNRILDFYIETYQPAMTHPPLLNGDTLIDKFQLAPSPFFRYILSKVEKARVLGTIQSEEDAERLVQTLISRQKESGE